MILTYILLHLSSSSFAGSFMTSNAFCSASSYVSANPKLFMNLASGSRPCLKDIAKLYFIYRLYHAKDLSLSFIYMPSNFNSLAVFFQLLANTALPAISVIHIDMAIALSITFIRVPCQEQLLSFIKRFLYLVKT